MKIKINLTDGSTVNFVTSLTKFGDVVSEITSGDFYTVFKDVEPKNACINVSHIVSIERTS